MLITTLAAQADIIVQQASCDECVVMPTGYGGDFTARQIRFHAPGRGTLILSFQGTLNCSSNSTFFQNFIIFSQIVQNNRPADPAGPSGLTFATGMLPNGGVTISATFNLASTRVFRIGRAGVYRYRFRLHRFGIDPNTSCSVDHGAFLAHFVQ